MGCGCEGHYGDWHHGRRDCGPRHGGRHHGGPRRGGYHRGHHRGRHHHRCDCGCGGRPHFGRRFWSREEVLAWLERYLEDLQAEAKAVEERIAEMKGEE